MPINLRDYEVGAPLMGDFAAMLANLHRRLDAVNAAHIASKQRSIIVLEGWGCPARYGLLRQMAAMFDPRYLRVWGAVTDSPAATARHFLRQYWQQVPDIGELCLLDHSWYSHVLQDRVAGQIGEGEWRRAYDEINEFEAQLTGQGTHLVKLFLHRTAQRQHEWLTERLDDPAQCWQIDRRDELEIAHRAELEIAMQDMFGQCDTRWAPWHVIDANMDDAGLIAGLDHIAKTLESKVSMKLPGPNPDMVEFARSAIGYKPEK